MRMEERKRQPRGGAPSLNATKPFHFWNGFGGNKLATAYFCVTFRQAIIGFAAFHFRVRDGNGWVHCGISPEIYPGV